MDLDDSDCVLREQKKTCSWTTGWKAVIVTFALIIAIVISFTAISSISKECITKTEKKSNMCLSSSCINEASNLMNSLDTEVDPCEDFYSFVCGNWIKNTLLISNQENHFTQVATSILLRVKDILENLNKDKYLPEHKKKTRDFYKACTNQEFRNKLGAVEFFIDQKKFGGWPIITDDWSAEDFDWADLMIKLFKSGYGSYNMFFSINVDPDMKDTSKTIIIINQPSLGLFQREYYDRELYEELIDSYKNVILQLAVVLNILISEEKSKREIEEAFEIEYKIANLMKDFDSKNPNEYYNIRTLEDMEKATPKIPWRRLLQNLLPPNTELKSTERIMVANPDLITSINTIFEEMDTVTGKRIIANYMFYRMVLNAAYFLSDDIYDLTATISETSIISRGHHRSHWNPISIMSTIKSGLLCSKLAAAFFPLSVTASYAVKYMDNKTKNELGEMFENLRNSLKDRIRDTKWLDNETKDLALLKIRKMLAAIAYEDEIMDDNKLDSFYSSVNMTDYHFNNVKQMIAFRHRRSMEGLHETHVRLKWTNVENLLDANAYYQPSENSITIPVGVLQGAIFAPGVPNYAKYGSLGMIIGHELNHAFDSFGISYDDEGNYRIPWPIPSLKIFVKKLQCFQKQYSNYRLNVGDAEIPLDGVQTLDENVADNSGLQIAYYAYKKLLLTKGSEKSLPGLSFNEKQMFWISFASMWCEKEKDIDILISILKDVHTPSKFRVVGTLSNMKEFSEDFGCKLNSAMHPTTRCSLWD